LDEENHGCFEEIVFQIVCQMEIDSNFFNQTEECEAIDTVVNSQESCTIIITK